MSDTRHTWNDGPVIRAKKQHCGCHITARKFELCKLGILFKSNSEEVYRFYTLQREVPGNGQIIANAFGRFEIHRDIYLKHLETGWDWPRMMWGTDRCL